MALKPADLGDLVSSSDIRSWDLALAGVSLVATWIFGRLAQRATLTVLGRWDGISEDLRQLAARLVKYAVWLLGFGIALTFLGAPIQPLLAAAVILAVVAVLALRGIADNFAAGVLIQTRRPVQLGDEIEVLGHAGVITEMNGRSVVIETADGRTVHIPNAKMLDNPLVNASAHALRRSDVEVRPPVAHRSTPRWPRSMMRSPLCPAWRGTRYRLCRWWPPSPTGS